MSARRAFFEQVLATGVETVPQAEATLPAPADISLLLNRTSFGIREAEYTAAQALGYDAWLEYQLAYETIDVSALETPLASSLPTLAMTNGQLIDQARVTGNQFQAVDELRVATFLRQIYSPRQLYEVMVEFWTNHFNVQHIDGPVIYFKTVEDRELIRLHELAHRHARLRLLQPVVRRAMELLLDLGLGGRIHPTRQDGVAADALGPIGRRDVLGHRRQRALG